MTDPKPDDKPDTDDAVSRLKSLFNEVLDEREAKATAAKEAADKDRTDPDAKRTTDKPSILQTLFGG